MCELVPRVENGEQHNRQSAICHCNFCSSTHISAEKLLSAAICNVHLWWQISNSETWIPKALVLKEMATVVLYRR